MLRMKKIIGLKNKKVLIEALYLKFISILLLFKFKNNYYILLKLN